MKYKGKYGTLEIDKDGSLGFAPEVYCKEQNLGGKLTEGNVSALLKWKDTRLSPCSEKAKRVLARLGEINAFRAGKQAELEPFFGGGGVYNVFVKHIARPAEYPIYDTHVLNAYCRLEKGLADDKSVRTTPKLYDDYRAFFFKVYETFYDPAAVVRALKAGGTEDEWNALVNGKNIDLTGVTINYDYSGTEGEEPEEP